jgi:S1-C subfamily serine protease
MMGVMVTAASSPPAGLHPALNWGALVVEVVPGTPAAQVGLHVGDVIVAFNGRTVRTVTQLSGLEQRLKPGDWATVTWVTTSGQRHVARVRLVVGPAV